ncbi:glycosyltransferase family 39 protein [Dyella jejuensis]|uniref:Glycosyltransferase family 39 protein n=1 Tax=Dyella jejuensis TaxID=1432009 RepID=A0ABW8JL36_9GAMM
MKPGALWYYRLSPLIIVIAALGSTFWSLNARHYFYADDWGWLEHTAFANWSDIFHLFPKGIYNDRPAGAIFIFLMYRVFGLDSHAYNVFWLLLHVLNCLIFYKLVRQILPANRALIASIVAAAWFSTLIAVHWVGAIFDLAGATWCMLCVLLYVQARRASRWAWLLLIGAALTHILAIRCKEFAMALVVVLASWEFLVIESDSFSRRLIRLAPHFFITVLYGLIYIRLYRLDAAFVSDGAYKIALSPSTVLANVAYYMSQAFYMPEHSSPLLGYLLLLVIVVIGFSSRAALAGLISAAALMSAVLIMPNQRNILYLYAPHFFLAFSLCAIKPRSLVVTNLMVVLAVLLLGWPFYSHQWKWSRDFYLSTGAYSNRLMNDYKREMNGKPVPHMVTIGVTQPYFDPFSWGRGAALRLYYRNRTIKANVVQLSGSKDDPCEKVAGVCLVEREGHLVLHQ